MVASASTHFADGTALPVLGNFTKSAATPCSAPSQQALQRSTLLSIRGPARSFPCLENFPKECSDAVQRTITADAGALIVLSIREPARSFPLLWKFTQDAAPPCSASAQQARRSLIDGAVPVKMITSLDLEGCAKAHVGMHVLRLLLTTIALLTFGYAGETGVLEAGIGFIFGMRG